MDIGGERLPVLVIYKYKKVFWVIYMASQVLSGSGNVSYTNNTGQNVRVVINFLSTANGSTYPYTLTWGPASTTVGLNQIGRNLATVNANPGGVNNAYGTGGAAPTELMLAPGQTFSTIGNVSYPILAYNIVVIPEGG